MLHVCNRLSEMYNIPSTSPFPNCCWWYYWIPIMSRHPCSLVFPKTPLASVSPCARLTFERLLTKPVWLSTKSINQQIICQCLRNILFFYDFYDIYEIKEIWKRYYLPFSLCFCHLAHIQLYLNVFKLVAFSHWHEHGPLITVLLYLSARLRYSRINVAGCFVVSAHWMRKRLSREKMRHSNTMNTLEIVSLLLTIASHFTARSSVHKLLSNMLRDMVKQRYKSLKHNAKK